MKIQLRFNYRVYEVDFEPPQKNKSGHFGMWRLFGGQWFAEEQQKLGSLMNKLQEERVLQVAAATKAYFRERKQGKYSEGELRHFYELRVQDTEPYAFAIKGYQSLLFENTHWISERKEEKHEILPS